MIVSANQFPITTLGKKEIKGDRILFVIQKLPVPFYALTG